MEEPGASLLDGVDAGSWGSPHKWHSRKVPEGRGRHYLPAEQQLSADCLLPGPCTLGVRVPLSPTVPGVHGLLRAFYLQGP